MVYCISDIHGCYAEFMKLLQKINFNKNDTLYVLGDMIDRGENGMECLDYIRSQPNIVALMGNHEMMMLGYYPGSGRKRDYHWLTQGGIQMLKQINRLKLSKDGRKRWNETLSWVRGLPLCIEVTVNNSDYFLSHAGFDATKPMEQQTAFDHVWTRENFILHPAISGKTCIFGHTPTIALRGNSDSSIWSDPNHKDKICIDGGCVYGGALAALRLDDGAVFYVKRENADATLNDVA